MAQIRSQGLIAGVLCACLCLPAFAADANKFNPVKVGSDREDPDAAPWKESKLAIPPFPKDENLVEFYVSAVSTAKFFIDKDSIHAGGDDGVVRYTLVVKSSGGAKNISYEGLQCEQSALKIYATGRADGVWVENPNAEWRLMRRISQNLHQGELARNFFCPNFVPIYTAAEGLNALRRGVHPDAPGQPR